jgi:hypothetical protein
MANYPKELAQDAAYQSHTGHLTGLWFLPKLAQGLNTNTNTPTTGNSITLLVEAYLSETSVSMYNPLQYQNPENYHQTGILGRSYYHYCGHLEEEQTTFVMFVFRKCVCNLRDFRLPP